MRDFTDAYRADTGAVVRVPTKWLNNPHVDGVLYVAEPPARTKPARLKRESVEPLAAEAATITDPGDAGDTTTKE